jgi:hypothetical protein
MEKGQLIAEARSGLEHLLAVPATRVDGVGRTDGQAAEPENPHHGMRIA